MKTILTYFVREVSVGTVIQYGVIAALISVMIVGALSLHVAR